MFLEQGLEMEPSGHPSTEKTFDPGGLDFKHSPPTRDENSYYHPTPPRHPNSFIKNIPLAWKKPFGNFLQNQDEATSSQTRRSKVLVDEDPQHLHQP